MTINITEENLRRQTNVLKKFTVAISFILLAISLTKNAYYIEGMRESVGSFGLIAFLLGWMDFSGPLLVWLANPLLFLSWVFLFSKRAKRALIPGILAVIFSMSFLFFENIVANEGGGKSQIISYDIGYWIWISSFITNLLGNFALTLITRNSR